MAIASTASVNAISRSVFMASSPYEREKGRVGRERGTWQVSEVAPVQDGMH